jgi:ABC-2 type transport system permease protein
VEKTVLLAQLERFQKKGCSAVYQHGRSDAPSDPALYQSSQLPVGVLLEGSFTSFFKNYPVPEGVSPSGWEPIIQGKPLPLFVLCDGDIPANQVQFEQGAFRAQPWDTILIPGRLSGTVSSLMNVGQLYDRCIGIMELRSREFKLRLAQ